MLFLVNYLPFETQIQCYLPREASPSPDREDGLCLELSSNSHSARCLVVLLSIYLFVSPTRRQAPCGEELCFSYLFISFIQCKTCPGVGAEWM